MAFALGLTTIGHSINGKNGGTSTAPPITIVEGKGEYSLVKHVDIYEDKEGSLTLEQIISDPHSSRFIKNDQIHPSFGFTSSVYWVRFSVRGDMSSTEKWLLEIVYPLFDHISLFLPQPNGEYIKRTAGDLLPFAEREIKNRYFLFNLPATLTEGPPVYIRFETESSMNILLTIWSGDAFAERDHHAQFGLGLYYGFILVMILYSTLMLVILRDINYFYYLFFIVNFGLYQATIFGTAYEYFWPTLVWWHNYSVPIYVTFSALGIGLFTRSFLLTKKHAPNIDKILLFINILCIFPALASLAGLYTLAIRGAVFLALIMQPISVTAAIICHNKGYRPARYFLLAWSMVFFGVSVSALRAFGYLPANIITLSSPQYGASLTMILLALALADRVNLMRLQTAKAEEQYQTIFANAKEGIFRTTPGGEILMANQALADIHGFSSPEEILQKVPGRGVLR